MAQERGRELKRERESSREVHVLNLVCLTRQQAAAGGLYTQPWPHGHGASYDPYAELWYIGDSDTN